MERRPLITRVIEARHELESHDTSEFDKISVVKLGDTVVIEILGQTPQTKRLQLVDDKSEFGSIEKAEDVDAYITPDSPMHHEILGKSLGGGGIEINDKTTVRLLEIIDYSR